MTRLRSRALANQFHALFGGGTLSGLGEGELLDRFIAARDESAFAELVARHGPMVLAVCRRLLHDPTDVDDAFQATFLVLIRKASGLRDQNALAPWLYGVAHRVARHARAANAHRRARAARLSDQRCKSLGTTVASDPADELARRETRTLIETEILRLPPKQQAAAVLCLVQGMTHEAAAQALGWPLGTLKTRVADARETLSRRLTRRGVAPSVLAALTRLDAIGLDLPAELAGRTIDAALRTLAGNGPIAGAAAALARRAARGMIVARVVVMSLGLACALVAAAASLVERQTAPTPTGIALAKQDNAPPKAVRKLDRYGDPLPDGAVVRLGTTRYRQDSPIYRIAYTPDGGHFVTDGRDSILRVWDTATGRIIRRIDSNVGAMLDFAITSRGHRVMVLGTTLERGRGFVYHVTMTEIATGRPVDAGSWNVDGAGMFIVGLCPDRQIVAIGLEKEGVKLLDAWTGAETGRFATGGLTADRIAFSRDGRRLAVESSDHKGSSSRYELRLFDVDRKEELGAYPLRLPNQCDPTFSPNGSTVAVTTLTNVEIFGAARTDRISLPESLDSTVCYTSDGRGFVGLASLLHGRIAVFDLAARRQTASFNTDVKFDDEIALAPDGRMLLTSSNGLVLHAWDLGTRQDRFATADAHTGLVTSVLVSPDGKTAVTGGKDETIRLWDLATGRPLRVLKLSGHADAVAISPGGRWLAAATAMYHSVFFWDLKHEGNPMVLATSTDLLRSEPLTLHFKDDDNVLLIDDVEGLHEIVVKERQVRPGIKFDLPKPDFEPPGPRKKRLRGAAVLPGGKRVAVNQFLGRLMIADRTTGKPLIDLGHGQRVIPSPDGRLLAISDRRDEDYDRLVREDRHMGQTAGVTPEPSGEAIRLVDTASGKEQHAMRVEGSEVWAMAFSPDGKTLAATAGWESGQIHLYDVATGKETRTIEGPPFRSPALAFTPGGSRLVTGMADGSVLVWDLRANLGR